MKILIISVHPDDETLGCGGTILRHAAAGDELSWLIATVAYPPQWSEETITKKADEVNQVAKAYGIGNVIKMGWPTVRMDTMPQADLIGPLRKAIESVRPEIVYLVHHGDVHTDHGAVFTAVLSVLKSFYMRSLGVRRILSYETLSSTEAAAPHHARAFVPNVYIDITPYLEQKLGIMKLYASELQPELLPRGDSAIRALARYRGATIGVEYAEAFVLIREVS